MTFLTKYIRSKHGVVFRLSNHTVQFNLFDHTKLVLENNGLDVTFIDKKRQLHFMSLDSAVYQGGKEVVDRLRYAREVLNQMVQRKNKKDAV